MIEIEKSKDIRKKLTGMAFLALVFLTGLCYFLGWSFEVKGFLIFLSVIVVEFVVLVVLCFLLIKFNRSRYMINRKAITFFKGNQKIFEVEQKDILKVECDIDQLDLDVLAFIDHNITVNVIKDGVIVEKKVLVLPGEITNVIKCKNPRCITSIEQGLPHVFVLSDEKNQIYRCRYCEEKYSEHSKRM